MNVSIKLLLLLFFFPTISLAIDNKNEVDRYIIKFSEQSTRTEQENVIKKIGKLGGYTEHTLQKVFNGVIVQAPPEIEKIFSSSESISFIEKDFLVAGSTVPWGIDRIDQRSLPVNNSYIYDSTGSGVTVYIFDTGIRASHLDFDNRAQVGVKISNGYHDTNTSDCHGHGTHVAGTIGGKKHGVAKAVKLVPIKVLTIGCTKEGHGSDVILGLEWVLVNNIGPAVINMSLQASPSAVSYGLQTAINSATSNNIPVIVAAGNIDTGSDTNSCNVVPAAYSQAFAVASSNSSDLHHSNSRGGICTDLYAPGVNIISTGHNSDTHTTTMSGTSMAAPHVTGIAALYLQREPYLTAQDVYTMLKSNATPNAVSNAPSNTTQSLAFSFKDLGTTDITSINSLYCFGQYNISVSTTMNAPQVYQVWFIESPNFNPIYVLSSSSSPTTQINIPFSGNIAVRACNSLGCTGLSASSAVHYYEMCM